MKKNPSWFEHVVAWQGWGTWRYILCNEVSLISWPIHEPGKSLKTAKCSNDIYGREIMVQLSAEARSLLFSLGVQTHCCDPPMSHSEGAADPFPRVKRLVRAAKDSPSSTVQITNKYSCTSKRHIPEWRGQAELGTALSSSDESLAWI
jgi:hypothetical protein